MQQRSPNGANVFSLPGRSSTRPASTSASAVCGNITSPIAKAASAAVRSKYGRWCSHAPNRLFVTTTRRASTLAATASHDPREQPKVKRIGQAPGEFGNPGEPPWKGDLEAAFCHAVRYAACGLLGAHEERHREILIRGQRRRDETRVDE